MNPPDAGGESLWAPARRADSRFYAFLHLFTPFYGSMMCRSTGRSRPIRTNPDNVFRIRHRHKWKISTSFHILPHPVFRSPPVLADHCTLSLFFDLLFPICHRAAAPPPALPFLFARKPNVSRVFRGYQGLSRDKFPRAPGEQVSEGIGRCVRPAPLPSFSAT